MKKSTLKSLVSYLNGANVANIDEIRDELAAELAKVEDKAQANRDLYAAAHDAVMDAITETPQTMTEIFAACEANLPEGFARGKVQYALLHYWNDEVTKIDNGRNPAQYVKRA